MYRMHLIVQHHHVSYLYLRPDNSFQNYGIIVQLLCINNNINLLFSYNCNYFIITVDN